MKYVWMLSMICWAGSLMGQDSPQIVDRSANWLSLRSARMLGCDSLATILQPVYARFLESVMAYRLSGSDGSGLRRLRRSHRQCYQTLRKELPKNELRLFRKLRRQTGNILLLNRRLGFVSSYNSVEL
ncbi:MAG: hypothetical protein ACK4E0_16610 [Chitinophagaceae bacterium]